MRSAFRTFALFIIMASLAGAGACRKTLTSSGEVVAIPVSTVPTDPGDPVWEKAPEYAAALLLQDVVDPRLMKASTSAVRVRAAADGTEVSFRLQWLDPRKDDVPGPGIALDGCAVQIPKTIAKEPPSPQMGEANRPVEVTFWRADWQAWASGRGSSIRDLYPNASVDHYPFQAAPLVPGSAGQQEMATRFMPAQALGNRREGPRNSAVEDLVADGPGTLRPEKGLGSRGKGIRTADGWQVAMSRRLPAGLAPGTRTQVAFAVWEGSQGETGSRKMRTGWISLLRRGE